MTLKAFCLFLLTVACCTSAVWYLSMSHKSATSVNNQLAVPKPSPARTPSTIQNPHNFSYLVNEPKKCEAEAPFLVILVTTIPGEHRTRQVIRETWGNETMFPDIRVVTMFLLGRSSNPLLNQLVEKEGEVFNDIVAEDFIDSYHNLTLKTMMGMRWVATFCSKAQYVLKTDSDIFVNVENLVYNLLKPTTTPRSRYFTGYIINSGPIRNPGNKWYMPWDLYPDSWYPPFASGTGYVFSGDIPELVFETSLHTRLLHLEDVYVAVCLNKLGIKPQHNTQFNHWKRDYSLCHYRHIITVHHIPPQKMRHIWSDMTSKKHLKC